MKYKHFNVELKSVNDEDYTIKGVFSTADEDRHGEIVDQKTWQLDDYLQNPVILFAHDHQQPAIGKAINLFFNEQGNLEGEIKFAAKEYDFANTIYQLYKGGYMRAFSVGFQNEVVEYDEENQKVTLKRNKLWSWFTNDDAQHLSARYKVSAPRRAFPGFSSNKSSAAAVVLDVSESLSYAAQCGASALYLPGVV